MIHNNNNYNSYGELTHPPRERTDHYEKKIFFSKNMDHLDQHAINGVPTPFVMIQPFGSTWINVDQRSTDSSIQGSKWDTTIRVPASMDHLDQCS